MPVLHTRTICLGLAAWLTLSGAFACDLCGCFMGVVPYESQSSISLFHRYRSFSGYKHMGHPARFFPAGSGWFAPAAWNSGSLPGESSHLHTPGANHHHGSSADDFEVFRVTELRLRWFALSRLEVQALVPLVMNSARMDGRNLNVSALGDVTFLASWHAITPRMDRKLKTRLILGGGIKSPSGNYYRLDSLSKRIDVLLQPGSGTMDGIGYAALALGYGKWGLGVNAMSKINGTNYFNERFANGYTANAQLFARLGRNPKLTLMPQVIAFAEHTNGLMYKGALTGTHRMSALLAGPGLDVFWNNYQFSAGFQLPVVSYTGDHTLNAGRMHLGITYNLTQSLQLRRSRLPEGG